MQKKAFLIDYYFCRGDFSIIFEKRKTFTFFHFLLSIVSNSNWSMFANSYDLPRPGWDNYQLIEVIQNFISDIQPTSEPQIYVRKKNKHIPYNPHENYAVLFYLFVNFFFFSEPSKSVISCSKFYAEMSTRQDRVKCLRVEFFLINFYLGSPNGRGKARQCR